MEATDPKPFRFMDLPAELRNKVYKILLCSFPPNGFYVPEVIGGCVPLTMANKQDINTSILLVNSQVHREAYDVMVKTNRFVLLRANKNFPLHTILMFQQLPIVTLDKAHISQFKGYVLELRLTTSTIFEKGPNHRGPNLLRAMICAESLGSFVEGMKGATTNFIGFSTVINLGIRMAPILDHVSPRYQDSLADFFSETTQSLLLEPFKAKLRGYKNVTIRGHVLDELANTVKTEVAKDEFPDSKQALQMVTSKKEQGKADFQSGDMHEAYHKWSETVFLIDCIRFSSSWSNLVAQGGQAFINAMAELYFMIHLNQALVGTNLRTSGKSFRHAHPSQLLDTALESIHPGFWWHNHLYQPPPSLMAKLLYRRAVCTRLWPSDEWTPLQALTCIRNARNMLPDDPKIKEEEELINQWVSAMNL